MRSFVAAIIAIFAFAAVATADDRMKLTVRLTPTADGVIARFELSRPVDKFMFAYDGEGVRGETWRFADGIALHETVVTRDDGAPFSAFEAKIEPRNEPTDATYPCLIRIGAEGLAFYAGYFVGHDEETTIEVAPGASQTVIGFPLDGSEWRVDKSFGHNAGHRYVYVGPRGYINETPSAKFVAPPDSSPELTRRINANLNDTLGYYTRATKRRLASKPLVLLAVNTTTKGRGVQGDTTNGPAVALRVFGTTVADDPSKTAADINHLVAHEAAHFWNSDTYHAAPGSPAWLWEGGADYWALNAEVARRSLSAEERRKKLERALNTCVSSLNERPLAAARSSTTYICGQMAMWIADISERAHTKGSGDIFAVWRRMFDHADENGGLYTLEDFLREVTSNRLDAKNALALFLAETGSERWTQLPSRLAPFRARLETGPPSDKTLRWSPVSHLLDLFCTGSRGAWHEPDYMKLDTGDRCGPLNGDPEVDTLNGHNLYTDASAAYAAAREACATNGEITLTRTGKPDKATATCTKPLPAAPPTFRILATP